VSQERSNPPSNSADPSAHKTFEATHYGLLGLHPSASVRDVRQAYRELSKLYHPDTTELTATVAMERFQQLNEAYATLSSPERRNAYDQKIGYSRVPVVRSLPSLNRPQPKPDQLTSSAYLDATDRPLSAGELFALFILGITFVGCLILAITIGFTKGETALPPIAAQAGGKFPPTAASAAPLPHPQPIIFSAPGKSPSPKTLRMEKANIIAPSQVQPAPELTTATASPLLDKVAPAPPARSTTSHLPTSAQSTPAASADQGESPALTESQFRPDLSP
jgi:DnaJ domain